MRELSNKEENVDQIKGFSDTVEDIVAGHKYGYKKGPNNTNTCVCSLKGLNRWKYRHTEYKETKYN